MDDYISKTIKAYDDTTTYENSTRLMLPKGEIDQFLDMLETGSLILDAGCAFGRDTTYMQSRGYQLKGVDLSAALIERAKKLCSDVDFKVTDVRATGFNENTFDGIWCNATLLHLDDSDVLLALKEFNRIMKPGAILAVSFKKGEGTKEILEKFTSNFTRFFNFKTHETFLELLKAAGLKEVSWHYVNDLSRFGNDNRDLDWLYSYSQKQ